MNNTLVIEQNSFKTNDEYRHIKKAIAGDKIAFAEIIKRNKIYLYKTAYMYIKNEDKALDILHETISKALANIHKLKNPDYFKTWITRILINSAIDMNQKHSKIEELNEASTIIDIKNSISLEEKLDLYHAVDLLNDRYKTVIIMKYFNDMKIKEISEVMILPENTVKTYLNRAKTALRYILKEGYLND